MKPAKLKTVCIVQAVAKQYRKPFFDGLHRTLASEGVTLRVVYSDPNPGEAKRGDNINLPETYGCKVPGIWLAGRRLLYQPILSRAMNADLVVVEQANKYLMTYPLLAASRLGIKKVAFWGHGRNHQSEGEGASEWIKQRLINSVDWWFAYTHGVKRYVESCGVAAERITAVQNSVDISAFRSDLAQIGGAAAEQLRQTLGIVPGERVALYCGGLHADKRLPFFIAAAKAIRERLPAFRLIVVGAGADAGLIEAAAREHSWIHYAGPKFGLEKAAYFHLAEVFLCPGLVGLAVLDAFAAGLPIITTDLPIHSPEIEYLEHGGNGLMTPHDTAAYAEAVAGLLGDSQRLAGMRAGAVSSSSRYSLEQMVANFSEGVLACLRK